LVELADPQTAGITAFEAQEAVVPVFMPAHCQLKAPVPVVVKVEPVETDVGLPAEHRLDEGAEAVAPLLDAPHTPFTGIKRTEEQVAVAPPAGPTHDQSYVEAFVATAVDEPTEQRFEAGGGTVAPP
jgi:hypothetical protein